MSFSTSIRAGVLSLSMLAASSLPALAQSENVAGKSQSDDVVEMYDNRVAPAFMQAIKVSAPKCTQDNTIADWKVGLSVEDLKQFNRAAYKLPNDKNPDEAQMDWWKEGVLRISFNKAKDSRFVPVVKIDHGAIAYTRDRMPIYSVGRASATADPDAGYLIIANVPCFVASQAWQLGGVVIDFQR